MPDIGSRADIDRLLAAFYAQVFADELLRPVFVDVARMDLPAHLPLIGDFWEKVLLGTGDYQGQVLAVHRRLHQRTPLTAAHFRRWVQHWTATIRARHTGPVAAAAVAHAERIAAGMQRHLDRPEPAGRSPDPLGRGENAHDLRHR